MSDDEFDLDFVSAATRNVQTNWKKSFDRKAETKTVKTTSKTKLECDPAPNHKNKKGKENADDNKVEDDVEVIASDEDVALTPPGSPQGATPKNVRGAKMTKKTQKALEQLKTKTILMEKGSSRRSKQGKANTSLGEEGLLLLSDDEDSSEKTFDLKVRWKTDIVRISVKQDEKMGKIMDRVAEKVGLAVGEISLYQGENSEEQILRDTTVSDLGLSIVSVLYGRGRVITEDAKDEETIQVKLQTKDRRAQPLLLDIRPTDIMDTVMEKFSSQSGLNRSKLKFFFDGEVLDGSSTAEDLELEGGECIDVHVAA